MKEKGEIRRMKKCIKKCPLPDLMFSSRPELISNSIKLMSGGALGEGHIPETLSGLPGIWHSQLPPL